METTDRALLESFKNEGKEEAFNALMQRHAQMVMRVCRRQLSNESDAEEAFQATFVLLAQKAATIRKGDALGSWLYGVAYKTAYRLRENKKKSQTREKDIVDMIQHNHSEVENEMKEVWERVQPVLDEELNDLPEKYKAPLVLCYFEGRSYQEVADELGCSHDQARGKLAQARDVLRSRIAKRGVVVTSVVLTSVLTQTNTQAAVISPALMQTTLKAAVVASKAAGVGIGTTTITYSIKETIKVMAAKKLIVAGAATVLLAAGIIGTHLVENSDKQKEQAELKKQNDKYQADLLNENEKLKAQNEHLLSDLKKREEQLKLQGEQSGKVAVLQEQLKSFTNEISKPVPETMSDYGRLAGKSKRKFAEFQKKYPKKPAEGTQEYAEYLAGIDDLLTDISPLLIKGKDLDRKTQKDPQAAQELYGSELRESLGLNDNQAEQTKSIVNQIVSTKQMWIQEMLKLSPDGKMKDRSLTDQEEKDIRKKLSPVYESIVKNMRQILTPEQMVLFREVYPNPESLIGGANIQIQPHGQSKPAQF